MSILSVAIEYYDKNNELYEKIKNQIAYIETDTIPGNTVASFLIFFDSDNKILFRSKFGVIGIFYKIYHMWIWGWAHPGLEYEMVATIKNVFVHALSLNSHTTDLFIIKSELITSRFGISDDTQIDIHCAIASYLAHIPFIIKINQFIPIAGSRIQFEPPDSTTYPFSTYVYIMNPPNVM